MTKHILLAAIFTTPVWSAPESSDQVPEKPVLTITPFTLKSSDQTLEARMDDAGKMLVNGEHVATAHADGKLTSPDGEIMVKLNGKGILLNSEGKAGEVPHEILEDGTWMRLGPTLEWKDGKMEVAPDIHLTVTPKDSPSMRAATLFVVALMGEGPPAGNVAPAQSSVQVDAMDFTEEQMAKAKGIMATHRADYLAIEERHLTHLRDEKNFVQFEIAAFPDELKKLNESFWRKFDEICDDRQKRVARRYLVLNDLFPYGEYPVRIEIAHVGNRYSVQQRKTQLPDRVDASQESPELDPCWKRFWGDREDATANVLESVLGLRCGTMGSPRALTFEGDQPVLTADLVDTLNLGPEKLVRVNKILLKMRQEYLAVEKEQVGKVNVTEDPDGTKHFEVPPFHNERKALDKKLRAELGKVLDARQLRLVEQSNGLSTRGSELFDWGDGTYSLEIRDLGVGVDGKESAYRYEINGVMDAGFAGKGTFSESKKQLPENYRRLLSK